MAALLMVGIPEASVRRMPTTVAASILEAARHTRLDVAYFLEHAVGSDNMPLEADMTPRQFIRHLDQGRYG